MKRTAKPTNSKFWTSFPLWLIPGAVAVLIPIFILMTYQGIRIQHDLITRLLVEKGDALIRSFEAGTRTASGGKWDGFRLQKLLIETAQQPGIDYLIVADTEGVILADSDPSQVGEKYTVENGPLPEQKTNWRQVANPGGADTFEIYRLLNAPDLHLQPGPEAPLLIFVGLDMGPILQAREHNTRSLILTSFILLLVGFAGMVSLFILQSYRIKEIRRLEEEIERSRRLASIGSLAAGIAHEIRNPLSSIKGFATYFRERYRGNADDEMNANIMIQEVERLNRVIGQLLEFSRPVGLHRRKASLEEVVRHTFKLVEVQAGEKGIALLMESPSPLPDLLVDPDKMKQVLLNLCLNALESMPSGGSLTVTLSVDGGNIRITVTDTGTGIAEEDLTRVFDPYFTTKSTGTGLGLAVVHKIIEAHGGTIRVESKQGKGTTVILILPPENRRPLKSDRKVS